jgi:hypothetical protein
VTLDDVVPDHGRVASPELGGYSALLLNGPHILHLDRRDLETIIA